MSDEEIPLEGGNTNLGVFRVGDTVRRAQTPASPAIHALLRHLQAKGFDRAPVFLGIDEQNREILSFIEGTTDFPSDLWDNETALIETAAMLRAYHAAVADFNPPENANWAYVHPDTSRHEVIGHNDFAPYNHIFRDGRPVGVIDLDIAGPAPRLRDVAYAAYWLAPLSFGSDDLTPHAEKELTAGCPRLKLFCATYGIPADEALLDMVAEILAMMHDGPRVAEIVGTESAAQLESAGHFGHWEGEDRAFTAIRTRLSAALAG